MFFTINALWSRSTFPGSLASWTSGIGVWLLVTSVGVSQSALEQLEKKVRDGLELVAPSNADGDLPPPKSTFKSPPPVPKPSLAVPGSPQPSTSILESPSTSVPPLPVPPSAALPAPTRATPSGSTPSRPEPALRPAPPVQAGEIASEIYLGLDAESVTGGGIGARVAEVTQNSPAWRAGFQVGDVILAIDGYAIANLDTMVDRLALRRANETIKVLLMRGGRNVELTAVLQDASIAQSVQGGQSVQGVQGSAGGNVYGSLKRSPLGISNPGWMGIVVADLSPAFRTQFGVRVYRAAAVTNVTKGSPADSVNIQPGDVIIAVDQRSIESARELLDWMLAKQPGDRVNLTVMRGARTATLEVTLSSDPKAVQLPLSAATPTTVEPAVDLFGSPLTSTKAAAMPSELFVPQPENSSNSTIESLREQLRTAREQLSTLEQRIIELEAQATVNPPQ